MKKIILIILLFFSMILKVNANVCVYNMTDDIHHYIEQLNEEAVDGFRCYIVLDLSKEWFRNNNQLTEVPCGEEDAQPKYMPASLYCVGTDFSNNVDSCESSDDCDASAIIYYKNGFNDDPEELEEFEFNFNGLNGFRSSVSMSSSSGNTFKLTNQTPCPSIHFDSGNEYSKTFDLRYSFDDVRYDAFNGADGSGGLEGIRMSSISEFFQKEYVDDMGQLNEYVCENVVQGEDPTLGCTYTFRFGTSDYCTVTASLGRDSRNNPIVERNANCTNGTWGSYLFDGNYLQYEGDGGELIQMTIENNVVKSASCKSLYYKYYPESKLLNFRASAKSGYTELAAGNSVLVYSLSTGTGSSPIRPGQENDRYSDVETCTDVDVNHIKACGCIPAEVADITSKVYFILRLIGPIILLIIGGFEMAKAIAAQDESAIEKAKKKLVNKFIAAAAIFLVLTIIKLAVSLVAENTPGTFECVNILLDGYVI